MSGRSYGAIQVTQEAEAGEPAPPPPPPAVVRRRDPPPPPSPAAAADGDRHRLLASKAVQVRPRAW